MLHLQCNTVIVSSFWYTPTAMLSSRSHLSSPAIHIEIVLRLLCTITIFRRYCGLFAESGQTRSDVLPEWRSFANASRPGVRKCPCGILCSRQFYVFSTVPVQLWTYFAIPLPSKLQVWKLQQSRFSDQWAKDYSSQVRILTVLIR